MRDYFGYELHKNDLVYILDGLYITNFGLVEWIEEDRVRVHVGYRNTSVLIDPSKLALPTDDFKMWTVARFDL